MTKEIDKKMAGKGRSLLPKEIDRKMAGKWRSLKTKGDNYRKG